MSKRSTGAPNVTRRDRRHAAPAGAPQPGSSHAGRAPLGRQSATSGKPAGGPPAAHVGLPAPDFVAVQPFGDQEHKAHRGWRLALRRSTGDALTELVEEKVLPERVADASANAILEYADKMTLRKCDVEWLRDQCDALLRSYAADEEYLADLEAEERYLSGSASEEQS